MVKVGDKIKDFTLIDDQGNEFKLSNYLGKKVVIYLYISNETPGCLKQALLFKENYSKIKKHNAILVGISSDDVKSQHKFKEEHDLPFILLSDPNYKIISDFGALHERYALDRTFFSTTRSTYIIDEKGYLEYIWMPAISGDNPKEVVDYLKDNIE